MEYEMLMRDYVVFNQQAPGMISVLGIFYGQVKASLVKFEALEAGLEADMMPLEDFENKYFRNPDFVYI